MRPYYEHAGITIYHGDAREVLPTLRDVGVVIADPPYGVSTSRGDGRVRGSICGDDEPFDPAHLLGFPCAIFGANAFADKLPPSTGWLIWDKTHHDKSEHSQAELAWTNFVRGIRIYREAYHGFMRKPDGWLHPTQKPVGLFKWVLTLPWTPPGLVVDPYMGSGPTLVAAKTLGRRAIGIEIEERHCATAVRRLAQEVLPLGGPR